MLQDKRRLTSAEVKKLGWEALMHRLGPVDASRFVLEYDAGSGDYVQLREQLFEGKTVDDLCHEIEQQRTQVKRRE